MHRHKRLNCTLKYTMPHSKQDAYPTQPAKESRSPRRSSPPLCWLSLSLALLSCFIAEREHVESLCIAPVSNTYLHRGNNNCDRCVHDEVNTLIFNVHKRRKTGPQNQKQKQSQLMCSSGFHSCSLATLSDVAHSGTYREYINYCNCGSTTSQYDTRQQKHYHRFGRSLLGTCKRRVVFTYLQMTNKGSTASDSADDANANYEVDDDSESSTDSESVNATIIAINTTTSSVSEKENTTELQNIPDSSQPIIATTNKVDKGLANTAASATSKATSVSSTSPTAGTTSKWEANDFENDYRLLKTAIARQNNILNLRQQQRKHVLDHGFARNRRPLVQDVLRNTIKIGGWMLFLIGGGAGKGFDWDISSWGQTISLKRKCHILATQTIVTVTTIHHWVVGVALPLFLLTWAKYDNKITNDEGKFVKAAKHTHRRQWCKLPRFGPSARTLDDYSNNSGQSSTNAPLFFYTSKKRSNDKDTGDFIICILENWSSAVIASFLWEVGSFGKKRLCASISTKNAIGTAKPNIFTLQLVLLVPTFARLLNRIGAAASLHQYPSLLFELRRSDQPRPMCRPTAYMQSAVNSLLRWLPLGVASDLAVLVGSYLYSTSSSFTEAIPKRVAGPAGLLLNTAGPIFHIMALMRIIHVSKSSAVSLSKATSFQNEFEVDRNDDGTINSGIEEDDDISLDQREKIQWRYQLR